MLYLLAAAWGWFALALLVGLAVGWLTTTRQTNGDFSRGWVVLAAIVLLIGAGFLAARFEIAHGRAGLLFETALLILTAYAVGLPIGGGAKLTALASFLGAPPAKKPAVAVKGKAREAAPPAPRRAVGAANGAPSATDRAAAPTATIRAAAPADKAGAGPDAASRKERRPAPVPPPFAPTPSREASKKIPGARPEGFAQPRGGKADDLSRIKGIGPKSVEKLHAFGIWHFDQIAAWTPENVKWVSNALTIPGRVERGKWVAQARELASGAATREGNGASAEA